MSLSLAEVAPAAPAIAELGALVGLLIALGLVVVAHKFLGALFHVTGRFVDVAIGWVPWLGKKVKGGLLAVEHRVNAALSEVTLGLEKAIAETWHVLAATIEWLGHEIAHTAKVGASLWWYVNAKFPLRIISATVDALRSAAHFVTKRFTVIERHVIYTTRVLTHPQAGPIASGVKWGTRTVTADLTRLGRWIRAREAWLTHQVAVTIPGELGRLGGEVAVFGRTARQALRWARRHERLLLGSGFVALMVHALTKLGAGWIRCGNVRKVGRRTCSMDQALLDDLLAGTLAIVGTISLIEFAHACQSVTPAVEGGLRRLLRELS